MKKNIVFLGFNRDYEKLDIMSLAVKYNVVDLSVSPILMKMFKLIKRYVSFKFIFDLESYIYDSILKNRLAGLANVNLFVCVDNLDYYSFLKSRRERKVVIFRNLFDVNMAPLAKYKCYSFDKHDCDKYGFTYYNQFASGYNLIVNTVYENKFDLSFVGREKNRTNALEKVLEYFDDRKVNIVLKKKLKYIPSFFLPNVYKDMPYKEYLYELLSAKVVLELTLEGQTGCSMRVVEALLANKKVISINKSICEHPLYNSNNIYFLDFEKERELILRELDLFMKCEFISQDDLNLYSPQEVIGNIINDNL